MASKDTKWIKRVIILIVSFVCFSKGVDSQRMTDSVSQLISKLFDNDTVHYDQLLSPAISDKDPFPVNLSLTINSFNDLDEVTGTLTLNGWLAIMWTDRRLTWNPASIGLANKTVINVPTNHFWIPDITLENHIDSFSTLSTYLFKSTELALYSNGKIDWTFPVTLKASCQIDHRYYPFDECVCELRLISQTDDYSKIVLHKISNHNHHDAHGEEILSKRNRISNPVWTISRQKSEIVHNQKGKHNGHHNAYQYTVHLRRHSPGQKFVIQMPIVLAMGITLSVFWIAPTSGKRMTLGGIAVLIFLTMLLYIGWKIPSGGRHIPLVVLLCGVSLLMAGMSLVISVIVSQLSTCSICRPIPGILKSFLGRRRIRQLLCLNFPNRQVGDDGMQLMRNTTDVTTEAQPPNSTSDADPNELTLTNWTVIAYVTDRMAFTIYSFIFAILLFSFSI